MKEIKISGFVPVCSHITTAAVRVVISCLDSCVMMRYLAVTAAISSSAYGFLEWQGRDHDRHP
jgi:hypothetical protein